MKGLTAWFLDKRRKPVPLATEPMSEPHDADSVREKGAGTRPHEDGPSTDGHGHRNRVAAVTPVRTYNDAE
jgi:hypothetical protein